jgi:hypothetical protein
MHVSQAAVVVALQNFVQLVVWYSDASDIAACCMHNVLQRHSGGALAGYV